MKWKNIIMRLLEKAPVTTLETATVVARAKSMCNPCVRVWRARVKFEIKVSGTNMNRTGLMGISAYTETYPHR
jgi:hypothetical protein